MQPHRIAQRVKNRFELQRRYLLKRIISHGKKMARLTVSSTVRLR
jgi:hypothetical protein